MKLHILNFTFSQIDLIYTHFSVLLSTNSESNQRKLRRGTKSKLFQIIKCDSILVKKKNLNLTSKRLCVFFLDNSFYFRPVNLLRCGIVFLVLMQDHLHARYVLILICRLIFFIFIPLQEINTMTGSPLKSLAITSSMNLKGTSSISLSSASRS